MSSKLFGRYRELVLVGLLLALPLIFFVSNAKDPHEHNFFDRLVLTVSAPIQWVVEVTLNGVTDAWTGYVYLVGVQARNTELEAENSELRAMLAAREEQRLENERLRLLLGVRESSPRVATALARVIAEAPSPLFRSIRIDRGTNDGVALGAPVMTHDGAVGRVVAVAAGYADVMLLVDASFSTDVIVQRTRARARVRGSGGDGTLRVEQMARTADVEPGDTLITSGVGGVFPKGLTVGRVVSLERRSFGLYQNATVEPGVDFGRLEEMLVITGDWSGDVSFEPSPPIGADAPEESPVAGPPTGPVDGRDGPWAPEGTQ